MLARNLVAASIPLASAIAAACRLAVACNDEESRLDGGTEAAAESNEAGGPGHTRFHDAEVDAAPPPLGCTDDELAENDKTDGGALEVVFNKGANPAQYANRCATVNVGASVTFSGSFVQHPLVPAGGDSPSPIPHVTSDPPGGKLVVTMTRVGTFGFRCEFHPALMFGAIRVVP